MGQKDIGSAEESFAQTSAGPIKPLGQASHNKPLVLVVDDTAQIRLLLRLNFELEGFDVVEAFDGKGCLEYIHHSARTPDLITIDAIMDGLDGWTTITQLKCDPLTADIPVMMITASVQAHQRARAQRGGVDAFVAKPFEPTHVIQLARSLTKNHW